MRIIESAESESPKKQKNRHIKPIVLTGLILVAAVGGWAMWQKHSNAAPSAVVTTEVKPAPQKTENLSTQTEVINKPKQLKTLTGEQFKSLYNNFAYPNVIEVSSPPVISGNATADKRIQMLAENRGYALRSGPATALQKVDGFPLQQKANQPWLDIKAAAAKEGIKLALVSAFRSVDEQRAIFLQRLAATGATIPQVAAGQADNAVNNVLVTSSIPGYSRHHTGYTVDLMCNGQDFNFFANTVCFTWLSKNNYENAKKFGWIPSYPEGTGIQGPDPEAWEYVWVGTDALYE